MEISRESDCNDNKCPKNRKCLPMARLYPNHNLKPFNAYDLIFLSSMYGIVTFRESWIIVYTGDRIMTINDD